MNIDVSNLAHATSERDLRAAFEAFGDVSDVHVAKDPATGRSRGFGWVVMPDDYAAQHAIEELDGKAMHDHLMSVRNASL